jgi:23S rRNA (uracil1939-C5)-methyltransferase
VFGVCGGCDLQHAKYATQLEGKVARLHRHLERIGAGDALIRSVLSPDDPWAQRTTVVLQARASGCGFLRRGSREVVPVTACPAAHPRALALATEAWSACVAAGLGPLLAQLSARVAPATGETQLLLGATAMDPGFLVIAPTLSADAVTLLIGDRVTHLRGPERMRDVIGGVELRVSPQAFFQTSAFGARALLDAVRELVGPASGSVLDLYCGGGLFALGLAATAREVLGIEGNALAVGDARAAAEVAGVGNVRFQVGDVGEWVSDALVRPDVVVLDPPRTGCAPDAAAAIARMGASRIVYVSCDLHALARDLGAFMADGYAPVTIQPVDMFAHTHHLEVVVALDRT